MLWTRRGLITALLLSVAGVSARAAEGDKAPQTVGLFEAIKQGQIEAKLIPANSKEARVFLTNKTQQPLSVRIPEGIAGVPILAQPGVVGGGVGAGAGAGAQSTAIGGFGGGGLGGGAFNIAPEKVSQFKVPTVCLQHGAPDPSPQIPYKMIPIEDYTDDVRVQELAKTFSRDKTDQRTTQAAAWNVANGMSWEELARKQLKHLGGRVEPYFAPGEIVNAMKLVQHVDQLVKSKPPVAPSTSPSDYSYSSGSASPK